MKKLTHLRKKPLNQNKLKKFWAADTSHNPVSFSSLNLITFRLNTLSKIQTLQGERNELIKQKDLLDLPMLLGQDNLTISNVGKRITLLSVELNKLIKQVRNFTQPRAALEILKNPELVELNSKTTIKMATHIAILTLLGFLILSIFSFLLPSRKN